MVRSRLLSLLAGALLAALFLFSGARADGLHCKVLDGEDLEEAWRRIVRRTWPERKDGVAPRVTSHQGRPLVETAIREMLAVLQFVDEYNYAADSPTWMATEQGRGKAREQAKKIFVELGRGAAPAVWQAVEMELRFRHPAGKQEKLVKPFREAQRTLRDAQELLEAERRQDVEYRKSFEAHVALRPKVHALEYLERTAAELRREKVAARGKAEALAVLDDEIAKVEARAKALGELRELAQKMKDLQAAMQERLREVDLQLKVAELKAKADKAREALLKAMQSAGGLGQGLLEGGDPAMVSHEEFLESLKQVLTDMGPEALPVISAGLKAPAEPLKKFAQEVEAAWAKPERAAEFARAAADGRTQVALAAARFVKDRLGTKAVEGLLKALESAPAEERSVLFKGLKLATGVENVADDPKAWQEWWAKEKPQAKTGEKLQDE